jgi:hypothetical protein
MICSICGNRVGAEKAHYVRGQHFDERKQRQETICRVICPSCIEEHQRENGNGHVHPQGV